MKRRRYDLGLAGLGIELAAAVIGFTLLGLWIDRRFATAPWAVVICASIGFVGGMYNFIRSAQKAARRSEARAAEARGSETRASETRAFEARASEGRASEGRASEDWASEDRPAGRQPVNDVEGGS